MEPKQTKAQREAREQDSLAPLQLDRLTIEEEVAIMNRGKGAKLLGVVTMVGVLVAGGAVAMKGLDREEKYTQAGAVVTQLRREHLDGYLKCVLPGAHESTLSSSERLHGAIEGFAERFQKSYARTLESCEPKIAGLGTALATLPVPSEVEPAIERLRKSASAVQGTAVALRSYLDDPTQAYDYVQVTARIDKLARASAAYRKTEADFAQMLDHKL